MTRWPSKYVFFLSPKVIRTCSDFQHEFLMNCFNRVHFSQFAGIQPATVPKRNTSQVFLNSFTNIFRRHALQSIFCWLLLSYKPIKFGPKFAELILSIRVLLVSFNFAYYQPLSPLVHDSYELNSFRSYFAYFAYIQYV